MTPLSGVRSSWLMLARNWLLARLAASAILRATVRDASRSSTRVSMALKASTSLPVSSPVTRTARVV